MRILSSILVLLASPAMAHHEVVVATTAFPIVWALIPLLLSAAAVLGTAPPCSAAKRRRAIRRGAPSPRIQFPIPSRSRPRVEFSLAPLALSRGLISGLAPRRL